MNTRKATEGDIGVLATARFAYTGTPGESNVRARGRIVAYCPVPQVCIETDDGQQVWWRADMTEIVAKPDEPTGLGAVVCEPGKQSFVRRGYGGRFSFPWVNSFNPEDTRSWGNFANDVKVLSEGHDPAAKR